MLAPKLAWMKRATQRCMPRAAKLMSMDLRKTLVLDTGRRLKFGTRGKTPCHTLHHQLSPAPRHVHTGRSRRQSLARERHTAEHEAHWRTGPHAPYSSKMEPRGGRTACRRCMPRGDCCVDNRSSALMSSSGRMICTRSAVAALARIRSNGPRARAE